MDPGLDITAGVVLAAGSSRRMGSPKQLLPVGGRPLLELVVAQACASKLDEVVVVLGAAADEIRRQVDFGRARILVNPDHASGMASSLRAGLASLGEEVDRAVVILGDATSAPPCSTSCWSCRSGPASRPPRSASARSCIPRSCCSARCGAT